MKVCSIDNMPTQLPRESTDLFAEVLYPHTLDILKSDAKKPLENHKFSYPIYSVGINRFVFQNNFLKIEL